MKFKSSWDDMKSTVQKSIRQAGIVAILGLAAVFIGVGTRSTSEPTRSTASLTDTQLLDTLQHTAFNYFWNEANASNGLIKDRSTATSACSIASTGFGLTAIGIGIDHGWIGRSAGGDRTLTTLKTFWRQPQGAGVSGTIGYRGWFYHFLDMATATRAGTCELSSIDTGLLLAGVLYARQYFDGVDSTETAIRAFADSIFNRVDWNWMTYGQNSLTMGWTPESGFLSARWSGYNEAMILLIEGIGATSNSLPYQVWNNWTSSYSWQTNYGYSYVNFPPLFGHQYSHCWIDFRNIADYYMGLQGITYFENSRRATLANRAYCAANPGHFTGYSDSVWGLTACDGPSGYKARGAPPAQNDDGTIAPTAAAGSIPFTPNESIAALQAMYTLYGNQLWGQYGLKDAFNISQNWYDSDYIGIDEGPIIIMIENYRTQRVWHRIAQDPVIQAGLARAGFRTVSGVEQLSVPKPRQFRLGQNYPNPFNPSTQIVFSLSQQGHVSLTVYDELGRLVTNVLDRNFAAGSYRVSWNGSAMPSGVYFYRLKTSLTEQTKKMILLR
jgi:hypothetical protein